MSHSVTDCSMAIERVSIALQTGLWLDGVSVHSSGDTVSGTVEIFTRDTTEVEGIIIKCKGGANVRWIDLEETVERSASVTCLDLRIPLMSAENGSTQFTLAGNVAHHFPFSFALPENIASSFEGPYGHVRYTLRVLVYPKVTPSGNASKKPLLPWKKKNNKSSAPSTPIESVVPFKISGGVLDLNTVPEALRTAKPVEARVKVSETTGWICTTRQKLPVKAWLNRSACIPGETILFNASFDRERIIGEDVSLKVVEITEYGVNGGLKKKESRILDEITLHGSDVKCEDVPIKIPNGLVPSGMPFCSVISINYELVLTLEEGKQKSCWSQRWSDKAVVHLKLLVGTIPLGPNNGLLPPPASAPPAFQLSPVIVPANRWDALPPTAEKSASKPS